MRRNGEHMSKTVYDYMNWAGIEAIVYGEETAPRDVMGPRLTPDGVLIQGFFPGAKSAAVAVGNKKYQMELEDEAGYYGVLIPGRRIPEYEFQIQTGDKERSFKDAYGFGGILTEEDETAFLCGVYYEGYKKLGAHPMVMNGVSGTHFAVWAPNAIRVSVVGDFNDWDGRVLPMHKMPKSGIFQLFVPGVKVGDAYRYEIKAKGDVLLQKADPYGNRTAAPPEWNSVVADVSDFEWNDSKWMKDRKKYDDRRQPVSIYETSLGKWNNKQELVSFLKEEGYTHVELHPVMEFLADEADGYPTSSYFALSTRYGEPKEFAAFVDQLHQEGIGVILDWVPAHFPRDSYGLAAFDGTCLYEHQDPRQGSHPHWGTLIYNYGRPQVSNYLIANALFWVEKYHADGIRMDAVASMLYLDYGRQDGEWIPNMYGGNENLEAIELIKHLNSILKKRDPGVLSIAEESTAFPLITGSLEEGGLGFDLKWNMGFMNDYLDYIKYDPYFRSHHHGELTFSMIYAYSEKFMLVFSHDEVVHGKGTLLGKMPGDRAQKLANLRLTYGYMMTHPGKKLLFMGQDLAEEKEWNEMRQVEWALQEQKENAGVQRLVKDLNALYRETKALYECDDQAKGFQWMNEISANECYVSFVRKGEAAEEMLLVVANFSGVPREITTGVPYEGKYKEILNTDAVCYGGTGVVNDRVKRAEDLEWDDKKQSVTVKLAPLSLSILQFIPYTEAELEKVIEKRIRKNTPIRKTTNKTAKKKQEK